MVKITMIAIEQLVSDFNPLLIYFCGYWETTKIFLSNNFNNKVIPNKKIPEYSIIIYRLLYWLNQ